MPTQAFNIWNSQTFNAPAGIQAGVPVTLASSAEFSNSVVRANSVVVTLDYELITPDITAGLPPFSIGAVLEVKDANAKWNPAAYQFTPYRNSESPPKRIIRMQPDVQEFNAGIDNSVFPIDREIARISLQQGKLPETAFRVCLLLVDNDPSGPNKFVSVRVSASGEQYDV